MKKSYERSCQEIEELKRRCYRETNPKTQQKLDEHSVQHGWESQTVSLLRDQVRKLQEQLEFIKDSKEFHDPDSPSSSGKTHVPHQHRIASSSKIKPSREPGLPRDTREDTSNPANAFDCLPTRRDPDELYYDSRNLATTSRMTRKEGYGKNESGEPVETTSMPCFQGKAGPTSLDKKKNVLRL